MNDTQRQLRTEQKKGSSKVDQTKQKVEKLHQNVMDLEAMIEELFKRFVSSVPN